jgi:hypothetical protein
MRELRLGEQLMPTPLVTAQVRWLRCIRCSRGGNRHRAGSVVLIVSAFSSPTETLQHRSTSIGKAEFKRSRWKFQISSRSSREAEAFPPPRLRLCTSRRHA